MRYSNNTLLKYPSLSKDCIAAWCPSLLKPTDTILVDYSPYNRHGVLTNMDAASDWVINSGNGGDYALDLDSTNDYISLSTTDNLLETDKAFTISWWENLTSSGVTYMSRFQFPTLGQGSSFIVFASTDSGYTPFSWRFTNSTSAVGFRPSGAPTVASGVGIWRHFCITGNNATSTTSTDYAVFIDGIQYTVTGSSAINNKSTARIGYDGVISGANCLIDDIRIYSRQLTEVEIKLLSSKRGIAFETQKTYKTGLTTDVFTASAGLVLGGIESSISATFTSPVYTSSASLTLGNIESVSTATFTPLTFTGSAALTLGKLNMEAFLTFVSNTFTATSDLTLGNIESVIAATFTSPVYTATSDLTIGNIESVSTALFASVVRSATADLTLGNVESVSTATFTVPTYTATTSLTLGNIESVSTATFISPVFTATAALTLGNIETTASATFAGISYTATVIVLLGGIELVGESVFLAAPPIAWHYYKYLLSGNVYEYYV